MNQARQRMINVAILNALDSCGGFAMPEDTLLTQAHLTIPGGARASEVREHLRTLEAQRLIVSVAADDLEPVKYALTSEGKAKLAGITL